VTEILSKKPLALFLLSVESGEKRRLTNPSPQLVGDGNPSVFPPDGHAVAFSRAVDFGLSDLYMLIFSDVVKPREKQRKSPSEFRRG
jgi:hypothetical protein